MDLPDLPGDDLLPERHQLGLDEDLPENTWGRLGMPASSWISSHCGDQVQTDSALLRCIRLQAVAKPVRLASSACCSSCCH